MIAREIEKAGIPVAFVTAMTMLGIQMKANRIIAGTMIPHPCGDPHLSEDADRAIRQKIVECALQAIQTDVGGPTVFAPEITFTYG